MKNFLKKGLLAAAAFAMAIALVPARPAEASSKVYRARTATRYEKKDGEWVKTSVSHRKFNKKGLLTYSETIYYDNGKKISTNVEKYTYKKGKQTGIKYYTDGKLSERAVLKYKGSKVKSEAWYNGDSKKPYVKYKYTYKKGKLKTVKRYGSNGKLSSTSTYTYNGKKKTTINYKDSNGDSSKTMITRSYKKKKLAKESYTYDSGAKDIYTYNSKGNMTKNEYIDSEGGKHTYNYSYKYYKKKYIKEERGRYATAYSDGTTDSGDEYKVVYSDWKKY